MKATSLRESIGVLEYGRHGACDPIRGAPIESKSLLSRHFRSVRVWMQSCMEERCHTFMFFSRYLESKNDTTPFASVHWRTV
ncbi:hypothetical protein L484_012685 [Morus notabilis]|uniref:Uncharacterized protein n=1 Tax=Morus notabilis TaxID=981085 RepID=W9QK45_9ROSA|nr:hypothetical protein L484_012685 [Morus notabilis]